MVLLTMRIMEDDQSDDVCNEWGWIMMTKTSNTAKLKPVLSSFVINSDICIVTPIMQMGSARDMLDSHFPEGKGMNINMFP